jgi:long-subunit acyl-CoA synthetase (AMP-forming)
MLFHGIIASGGIFAGSNPGYTEFELIHHIKTAKSKFLITEPEMLGSILKAAEATGIPKSNIWVFDTDGQKIPEGFKSWKVLLEQGEKDWVRFDDEKSARGTTAARLFSSGTTGLPKAAGLSHYNLIAQHTLVHEINEKPWEVRISRISIRVSLTPTSQEDLWHFRCSMLPPSQVNKWCMTRS